MSLNLLLLLHYIYFPFFKIISLIIYGLEILSECKYQLKGKPLLPHGCKKATLSKMCKGNNENLMKIEGIILWLNCILDFESSQETSHSFPNLGTRRTEHC